MGRAWIVCFALLAISGLCLGEDINQTKLEDNEQAQAEGREEEEPVVSHVVEAADEVELQRWVHARRGHSKTAAREDGVAGTSGR